MRFKGLDLNLLQALDILLEEKHVSRAAERMHVTQPAMSGALTRLRQYFKDPLLTQHGKRMIPTPHALSLIPKLKIVLSEIDALVVQLSRFDPLESDRKFTVIASDYVVAVIFPKIAELLSQHAPKISIEFRNPSERSSEQFEQGEIDLLITPEYMLQTKHEAKYLYDEEQVVLAWEGNAHLKNGRMSKQDFFECPHVIVELGRVRRGSYVESYFSNFDRNRNVALSVSSFLSVPELLKGTNLITVTHLRLAKLYAERLGLVISPLPFDLPPMRQMLACHQARTDDPGVEWLRTQIHSAAKFDFSEKLHS